MRGCFLPFFLFLSFLFVSGCSDGSSGIRSIWNNNQSVSALVEEKPAEALRQVLQALAHDPFNPKIQMNLGIVYESREDFDRAFAAYGMVLQNQALTEELRFQALFNQARVEGNRKNIENALALYQEALKIDSRSVEVKHNIEQLLSNNGGGGGGGDQKSDDNSDEGEGGEQPKKPPQEPKEDDQEKQKPQDLSQEEIEKILEELSRQEKKIRAKELDKEGGQPTNGKNW